MKFRSFLGLFKEIKDTPHHPELTNFLSNNETFQKSCIKAFNLKQKFWKKLDEAAFPEDYKDAKYLEQNSQNESKK